MISLKEFRKLAGRIYDKLEDDGIGANIEDIERELLEQLKYKRGELNELRSKSTVKECALINSIKVKEEINDAMYRAYTFCCIK